MPSQGILGARPGAGQFQQHHRPPPSHAYFAAAPQPGSPQLGYPYGVYPFGVYGAPSGGPPVYPTASWNQAALANAFNTMTLQQPDATWYMDSGVSSHLSSSSGNLASITASLPSNSNIIVGNGTRLPITCSGHTSFPNSNRPLHLSNVLVSPHLIANLVSVRKFTKDN
jgi:hypothetical protein